MTSSKQDSSDSDTPTKKPDQSSSQETRSERLKNWKLPMATPEEDAQLQREFGNSVTIFPSRMGGLKKK
jgi:hypothetical protein